MLRPRCRCPTRAPPRSDARRRVAPGQRSSLRRHCESNERSDSADSKFSQCPMFNAQCSLVCDVAPPLVRVAQFTLNIEHSTLGIGFSATIRWMKDRLLKKFEDEIQALDRELKTELPREIKRARELGDLRENAEYQAAKERQRLVESRISMLQKRVSEISLMNLDRIPTDRAGFGSTLHVTESNGDALVFQLVMPED